MSAIAPAPQRPRVYVETYGCSFNVSDGEVMAGLLERDGFEIVSSPDSADAVIVNSCTVKDRTYRELQKRVHNLASPSAAPAVILAGCAPRVPQQSARFSEYSQVGPDNLSAVPEVVRRTLAGERVVRLERVADERRLELPVRRRNAAVEIIPISKGCLGACTFCQTVLARGRLKSFPEEQILHRISSAVAQGVNQVWLTSQDCGAYGLDCGTNLPRLMRRISKIPGDFRVRVGMANPDLIKLYLAEFVDALAAPQFYQFAHVPLQSGSDRVLRDMKRLYTCDDFLRICDALRAKIPDVTIATDIIAGFPTETDADFHATVTALQKARVPVVNRSRFSPRTGTAAARLPQLPGKVITERSNELCAAAKEISARELGRWVGWTGVAWAEEQLRDGVVLTRNFAYQPIVLQGELTPGAASRVQITMMNGFHLEGRVGPTP
jgi:threonylcarbamoyladenosine tRNA methylthiotransferase CDKAL1